ncbi:MAG TPA: MBL fold metallo-hydrolase [Candidatus Nitrosocosmicus sp.]|nr:MBL fold metallo-hydrolase [Candidatus Nitrosocosmicus sp.]
MKVNKTIYKCDYFTVEELASGVYGAFATEEGGALSNSGVIDLGEKTVVFDTFLSADAASELRKFAERQTGRKVSFVVNSHCHFDHTLGNCAFDNDTAIITTKKILQELKAHEGELTGMKKQAPQILTSLRESLASEADEMSKKMLERDIRYFEMLNSESFSLRLPDITFEDSYAVEGTSRKVLLIETEGHTGSDIMLYLPEEKIAFTGDLLFTGTHPWLGAGDPEQWINTLHGLQNYELQLLLPGHGYAGRTSDVTLLEEYIRMIEAIAVKVAGGEYKAEDLGEEMLKAPFKDWKGNKFLPNVKFYIEYMKRDTGKVKK